MTEQKERSIVASERGLHLFHAGPAAHNPVSDVLLTCNMDISIFIFNSICHHTAMNSLVSLKIS